MFGDGEGSAADDLTESIESAAESRSDGRASPGGTPDSDGELSPQDQWLANYLADVALMEKDWERLRIRSHGYPTLFELNQAGLLSLSDEQVDAMLTAWRADFQQYMRADPSRAMNYGRNFLNELSVLGMDELVLELGGLMDDNPQSFHVYPAILLAHHRLGKPQAFADLLPRASRACQQNQAGAKDYNDPMVGVVGVLFAAGDIEKATQYYPAKVIADPDVVVRWLAARGYTAQAERVIALFDDPLDLERERERALYAMAIGHLQADDIEQAQAVASRIETDILAACARLAVIGHQTVSMPADQAILTLEEVLEELRPFFGRRRHEGKMQRLFGACIQQLCLRGEPEKAESWLKDFYSLSVFKGTPHYHRLIEGYAMQNKLDDARRIRKEYNAEIGYPDEYFIPIGLILGGHEREAFEILSDQTGGFVWIESEKFGQAASRAGHTEEMLRWLTAQPEPIVRAGGWHGLLSGLRQPKF